MAEKCINLSIGAFGSLKKSSLVSKNTKKSFNSFVGFSIAEAFIALAIFSVILGVSAPLISKTIKNQSFSDAQFSLLTKNYESLKTDVNSLIKALEDKVSANSSKISAVDSKIDKVMPVGSIIMWSGSTVPENWALCNGNNGTPDLRDKFIVGSGNAYNIGATGGANSVTLTVDNMPKHSHEKGTMRIKGSIKSTDNNGEVFTHIDGSTTSGAMKLIYGGESPYGYFSSTQKGGVYDGIEFDTNLNNGAGWTGSTSEVGSGTAHENRPPYYALAFIMRVK